MARVLRILPAILALGLLAPSLGAQRLSGGLRVGASVTTLRTDGPIDMAPAAGFSGGLWLDWALARGFAVQSGLAYLHAGADGTARAGDVFEDPLDPEQPVRLTFRYAYLQVPLMLAYEPPLRRRISPRFYAGPYVSFNQDAYVRYGTPDGALGNAQTDDGVRPRDYGVGVGGHLSFDTGAYGRLAVGAEASFGLSDVRESPVRTTNLGVLLFVGVVF